MQDDDDDFYYSDEDEVDFSSGDCWERFLYNIRNRGDEAEVSRLISEMTE